MTTTVRVQCALVIALLWMANLVAAQQSTAQSPALTIEQQETFLRTAEIQSMRRIGVGTTGARVATLSDGDLTHDAQVQTFDESRPVWEIRGRKVLNFRDSYRYNIAAYRLARMLGIENVPMSVERRVGREDAAVTWWIDDVVMDERERLERRAGAEAGTYLSRQFQRMYVFDALIWNFDRNRTNMLWTSDWTLWMIDHTRAFRLERELRTPDELNWIERSLLESMRSLTADSVREATGDLLSDREIEALMARCDLLVEHYEARIVERGEGAVLYTIER